MKRIAFISTMVFLLPVNFYAQTLRVLWGNTLYYQTKDTLIEIKRLDHYRFQGYDIIDSTHIFLAYIDPKFTAVATLLYIYDLKANKEKFIGEIGATGESEFFYNKENDYVLFDWHDGIYVFKLHDENGNIVDKIKEIKIMDWQGGTIIPFWVDKNTIVYFIYYDINKYERKYLHVNLP